MHISCTICTELYQSNEATGVTKCGHLFHIDCVKPWLQKHKTCPHCRADISTMDLTRVFFTEISSEDVHSNRNCKVNSFKAIVASEKEHVKNLQLDLRQAQNDLVDMNKHIERYENEIKNLKILNESLLDNSEKIESENKKLTKQLTSITQNASNSLNFCELNRSENSFGGEEDDDIVELHTIIASYEQANQQFIAEIEFIQKQLNEVIIQNEELQIKVLKIENVKNVMTIPRKNIEKNDQLNVNQKKKLSYQIKNSKLKKRNELSKYTSCKNVEQNLQGEGKPLQIDIKVNHPVAEILNTPTTTPTAIDSTMSEVTGRESFRKARDQIARLKLCPVPSTNMNLQASTIHEINREISQLSRSESFRRARIEIARLKSCPLPPTHTAIEKGCNEAINQEIITSTVLKNNKEFETTSNQARSNSFRRARELFTTFSSNDDKKHEESPIALPRNIRTITSLPPCAPPRSRKNDVGKMILNFNKNYSNDNQRNIQIRTPVDDHPLAIDTRNKTSPVGSIPLLGLCKNPFFETKTSTDSKEGKKEAVQPQSDEIEDMKKLVIKKLE